MPGKIKVKVLAGRNLPVMDRASDTTDAFVEIKFGSVTHKTDVCRKSLNPHWNSTEWYRFEVDESELQDEPLQLRLMDHDTYSANDAIGKVVISLAPLLAREANNAKSTTTPHGGAVMSGWIPVFDTMHGIRGELNVIVKVELFSDFNKYKTSSCGVQFFHCPMIPPGYRATAIHGFVEELVVNDDPEYQWIDKIRTPRASNEARQVAFIKLSNQVQRLVGLKAAELGANAVVGYQQDFDLEGEAGVVARAIGTAVSMAPLPTPSQPSNNPPCTQQQLKKYLDILVNDNESISDVNQYYQTHQEELQKLITILNPNASSLLDETDAVDDDEKSMDLTRQSSISSYAGSVSLYLDDYVSHKSLRHLSEDQTELNKLLNKEDDSDSSGPLQKIKKLKAHFFSKRFSSRRKSEKQEDQISLRSNSSDASRLSLHDIKNEFKKLRRLKKPKFRKQFVNKEDEGEGMASILARSVIHARTSLACIAETQDSEHSPSSTMRRTSESEPTINMSDDDRNRKDSENESVKVPEIRYTSLSNIVTENTERPARIRKISESCPTTPVPDRSENLLKLPGEAGYFDSVSSELSRDSSEMYSSSDEDDLSSDVKTDTEKSIETTSSVVKSVLSHDVDQHLIALMDKKLSVMESVTPDINEIKQQDLDTQFDSKSQAATTEGALKSNSQRKSELAPLIIDNTIPIEKCKSLESVPQGVDKIVIDKPVKSNEASTSSVKDDPSESKNSHHIKFNNPFAHKKANKSISAPSSPVEKSSFVHRSSKRIKRQLNKLSKSNMIKSLSHYSLLPKKKERQTPLSQPGSSSDMQSKAPSETVLGAPFLSYTDLLSLDKESFEANKVFHKSDELDRVKVSMYIGSEPVSRASLSGPSSTYHLKVDHDEHKKPNLMSTGLVHTAMETILLDKVQSLLMPTSPDSNSAQTKQFFNDVNEKLEKVEESRSNRNDIELNTIPSKAGSLSPTKSPSPSNNNKPIYDVKSEKDRKRDKSPSLMQTAMETMLIDKVQSMLIPTTPDSPKPDIVYGDVADTQENTEQNRYKNKKPGLMQIILGPKTPDPSTPTDKFSFPFSKDKKKEVKPTGLIHTAMETMLMEKVQSVLGPKTPDPGVPVDPPVFFDDNNKESEKSDEIKKDDEPVSLVKTAVETILLDNVQVSLLGKTPDPAIIPDNVLDQDKSTNTNNEEEITGLTRSALETILMDKVQSLVNPSKIPHGAPKENSDQNLKEIAEATEDLKPSGSIQIAVQTILPDKVQSLAPADTVATPEQKYEKSIEKSEEDLKSTGLVQAAIKTMLLDEVQTLVPAEIITIPEQTSNTTEDSKPSGLIQTAVQTLLLDKVQSLIPTATPEKTEQTMNIVDSKQMKQKNNKKLTRQDSVHSLSDNEPKMSKPSCKVTRTPVLQHFHPILSGAPLETIPSLPETSIDHTESIDSDTNPASVCNMHAVCDANRSEREGKSDRGSPRHARHESYGGREPAQAAHAQNSSLNAPSTPMGIHRRSSDSDLSVTPKGGSLNTSAGNVGSGGGAILRPSMNSNNLDMLEYPFLTMSEYPPGFIVHIGGTVCARSVKLVDGGGESAARAAWWAELRTELRAHARALRCNAVIAYSDTAAICEDVCVLSASGTAAVINLDCDFNADPEATAPVSVGTKGVLEEAGQVGQAGEAEWCCAAHVPYSAGAAPFRAELAPCAACRRARVPTVLLATCAKPNRLTSHAKAITLTAVAARVRRAPPTSEPGARDISDQLPFLEYELHKLLLAKLRMQGANALFSLQTQIAVGERCVMALASGAACRLAALPPPKPPTIKASENDKDALEIQKALWDSFTANRAANGYDTGILEHSTNGVLPETEDDAPALDLCADKDACVLELDEAEDVETARALAARAGGLQVYTAALRAAPAQPPQAFAQVWRGRLVLPGQGQGGAASAAGERHVRRALDGVAYKLRRLQPCALVQPRFQLELPEDEIQLIVSGAAIPLQDPSKPVANGGEHAHAHSSGDADDDIFELDEEQHAHSQPHDVVDEKTCVNGQSAPVAPAAVSLTSLSAVCGARGARRLCALRLLFVRETTAVRELGGLSGFLHTFTCEVLAIARAYTAALGGNALTSFYITQLMLQDNAHKNQGQCLLSVGGDVVHITY